jgi:hypothetical protein
MLITKSDSRFLSFAQYNCGYAEAYIDFDKGVFQHFEACMLQDRDKDLISTSGYCEMKSWGDTCSTTITGGTGKYAGITGTLKWAFNPDSTDFTRHSPRDPQQVKERFESSGEISELVEISWKLP